MARHVVLIVDDDSDTRVVFGTILRHHGYEVFEAADGHKALQIAGEHMPDLVIMDLEMPVLNGYEALTRLRANASTQTVPVVAVTALAWAKDRERALRAGFAECIVKPCEPMQLLARVRSYLPDGDGEAD
jgi:two-component system, cell cycle response regulator DivK